MSRVPRRVARTVLRRGTPENGVPLSDREAGIDPAPDRAATTWADFLHSQAEALPAADFIETVTLAGTRMYILRSSNTPAAASGSSA